MPIFDKAKQKNTVRGIEESPDANIAWWQYFPFFSLKSVALLSFAKSNPKSKTVSAHETHVKCWDDTTSGPIPVVVKMNKGGKSESSELEVYFGDIASSLIPELTPRQDFLIDDDNNVLGVVSQNFSYQLANKVEQGEIVYQIGAGKNIGEWSEHLPQPGDDREKFQTDCKNGLTFLARAPLSFDKLLQFHNHSDSNVELDMDSLAGVLTASYFLEEDDLHKDNIGFYVTEQKGKKVVKFFKIDHDLMFADSVMSHRATRETSAFLGADAFKVTLDDLEKFPDLANSKNHYWPTQYRPITGTGKKAYTRKEAEAFKKLKDDSKFIEAKWKYFLRYSLLPQSFFQNALSEHLDATNSYDNAQTTLMATALHERMAQFRTMLFSSTEMSNYLQRNPYLLSTIKDEIICELTAEKKQTIGMEIEQIFAGIENALKTDPTYTVTRSIHLDAYSFKASSPPSKKDADSALDVIATKLNGDECTPVQKFQLSCIAQDIVNHFPEKEWAEKITHYKNEYLKPTTIKDFQSFKAAVDHIRTAQLPLKQQKNEVIDLLNKVKKDLSKDDLLNIRKGLNKTTMDPSLKFLRQLNSGFWFLRLMRRGWEGYGPNPTSTVVQMRKDIDQQLNILRVQDIRDKMNSARQNFTNKNEPENGSNPQRKGSLNL